MRIIARKKLREFWARHADSENALVEWYKVAKAAEWNRSSDVMAQFPRASVIERDRVVFRIRGNSYRMVVGMKYRTRTVYIKWIGTHAEYDRIDASTVGE